MTMKLYDGPPAPNPLAVRLFIAERGGLTLDVVAVDLIHLANRDPAFVAINPFGTLPALVLDDGTVISDIVAVCEYLDEIATAGETLIGTTPAERALTRMWTRRVDKDIAQRFISWWRGSDDAIAFYQGHRIPEVGGRADNRHIAEQHLDMLDAHLAAGDTAHILGDRPLLPDILLFSFIFSMHAVVPWLMNPDRGHVTAWYDRMQARPAVQPSTRPVTSIPTR
ncbi:glutathione S-transferase family protein [Croceibacterium ferulae]|uniref:glutathione S-transferase family protein n=1 Tax=Croceibacterium ferulae TaxID=1854641 RepID=UPI0013903B17|nr:glutathione S-transferase family protein [Croceibacterium ferulae]